MSFTSRLASMFRETKASAVAPLISMQKLGQAVWTPRQYDKLAEESYTKNVVAYRSVGMVAQGGAEVGWLLYRTNSKGEREEVLSHPLIDLLSRPNPYQGGTSFFNAFYAYGLLAGNKYAEAVRPTDVRPPMELFTLRPDRMKVVAGNGGPSHYEYTVNGVSKVLTHDQCLHIKTFHPTDDWYGMSPVEPAAYDIDVHNSTMSWNKSLLDNRAQPSGAMMYAPKEGPQTLSDEQFTKLKQEMEEQYQGASNAGRPMLLEGGLSWISMGLTPQDMDYINSKNTSARDIALAFGVPPQLLGIPGDNTYSNMAEARLALYEQTILPMVRETLDELNNWLVPMFNEDGLVLDIDEDSISALGPRREAVWERTQQADFLTINEKRDALGYGKVDGGDQVLSPANMLPLGYTDSTDTGDAAKRDQFVSELKDAGLSDEDIQRVMDADYGAS